VDPNQFDEITIAVAEGETRRTVLRRVFGGGFAAALAAIGITAFEADEAEAKSCKNKCKKKNTKKKRRKCRKRCRNSQPECRTNENCPAGRLCEDGKCIDPPDQCQNDGDCDDCETCTAGVCVGTCANNETCIGSGATASCCATPCGGPEPEVMICCTGDETCVGAIPNQQCRVVETIDQQGSGTLASQSAPDCGAQGSCTDSVTGILTGTPILAGTFTGAMTGTNYQVDGDTFTADVTGTLTATETTTGDTLTVAVTATLTQELATPGNFTTAGTYTITGGTGRFAGASGGGTTTSAGVDNGQDGVLTSLTMDGQIVYA
jgi:hypothetical protein